ncbi:hypothetical protein [Aquimarina algicola]|uniref:Uncharacterized protein n=1 Tax=Aquimarina algicola TaxID=2589995 RepID=A0A504JJZ4_9FLAO|nr:hypothetical protein [Aquimarina algicola]TPN89122.1 hypothetical protein FHK87_02555 [Aquimarina algicola]
MEIRYTSLNDFDAHYIFDLNNNIKGIHRIHKYASEEIKAQKHVIDSLLKSGYADHLPKTYQEHLYNPSLSLTATDIYMYTPPKLLDRVRDEELVIWYEFNEETFTIKEIHIGNSYQSLSHNIKTTKTNNLCTFNIDSDQLTLNILYQIFEKIKKLKYQLDHETFTYQITINPNKKVLEITYHNKGNSLLLDFK